MVFSKGDYFIKMYILIWCCKAHAKNKFQMLSTKYYIMFFGVIRFFFVMELFRIDGFAVKVHF